MPNSNQNQKPKYRLPDKPDWRYIAAIIDNSGGVYGHWNWQGKRNPNFRIEINVFGLCVDQLKFLIKYLKIFGISSKIIWRNGLHGHLTARLCIKRIQSSQYLLSKIEPFLIRLRKKVRNFLSIRGLTLKPLRYQMSWNYIAGLIDTKSDLKLVNAPSTKYVSAYPTLSLRSKYSKIKKAVRIFCHRKGIYFIGDLKLNKQKHLYEFLINIHNLVEYKQNRVLELLKNIHHELCDITKKEIKKAIELLNKGFYLTEIAVKLNRTPCGLKMAIRREFGVL